MIDAADDGSPEGTSEDADRARLGRMRLVLAARSVRATDPRVIAAIEATPREAFVEPFFQDQAFDDVALPIPCGQTISQPSVVALMTQALAVGARDKVLEIGTGSGYQAAVLSHLCRRVYTVERHETLLRAAEARFRTLGLHNVTVKFGDGSRGWPEQAPFDRIIVTAAAEDPPAALLDQLREGGIMIAPVGQTDLSQQLIKVVKTEGGLEYQELGAVRFVPLLEGLAPG